MIALVTGATGFLGREVVKALGARDIEVRCLVHTAGREGVLGEQRVDVQYGSIDDAPALRAACHNVDVIIHLVAVIRESGPATFEAVNGRGTENVVAAARECAVKQLIYVSAIGARDDPTYPYLHSKWWAEQAVMGSGLACTILRPSILFGEGDEFVNSLAGLMKCFPVVPMAGNGKNRFQPMAVDEAAKCVAATVGREDLMGKVIEIGGPEHLSYDEIVGAIASTYGIRRMKLHVPIPAMRVVVRAMEALLPRPPATTAQLRMISVPNVAELNTVEEVFGFRPRPLGGSIEYVKGISFTEGLKIALGAMPARIRDH